MTRRVRLARHSGQAALPQRPENAASILIVVLLTSIKAAGHVLTAKGIVKLTGPLGRSSRLHCR
jgi:hypothetical protein